MGIVYLHINKKVKAINIYQNVSADGQKAALPSFMFGDIEEMYKVFVYGTLKEGFPNYGINKGNRLNGTFVTKKRFPLYLVGERYSPWLVADEGKGSNIKGQVFLVDETTLKEMDKLEHTSESDGYQRVEIEVEALDGSEELTVFAYVKPIEQMGSAQIRSAIDEYLLKHSSLYRSRNH